jgi:hypothetical protein
LETAPLSRGWKHDEENTSQTFEIQELGAQDIFGFWLSHGNQALHTGEVETQVFAANDD